MEIVVYSLSPFEMKCWIVYLGLASESQRNSVVRALRLAYAYVPVVACSDEDRGIKGFLCSRNIGTLLRPGN